MCRYESQQVGALDVLLLLYAVHHASRAVDGARALDLDVLSSESWMKLEMLLVLPAPGYSLYGSACHSAPLSYEG